MDRFTVIRTALPVLPEPFLVRLMVWTPYPPNGGTSWRILGSWKMSDADFGKRPAIAHERCGAMDQLHS